METAFLEVFIPDISFFCLKAKESSRLSTEEDQGRGIMEHCDRGSRQAAEGLQNRLG